MFTFHVRDLTIISGGGGDCRKTGKPVTAVQDCVSTLKRDTTGYV